MKPEIHPQYFPEATVICSCGNTWSTGSTSKEVRTDLCYQCHPFFTGEQRIVDTEGQVERFRKKLDAHVQYVEERDEIIEPGLGPEVPLSDFDLSPRALSALETDGINNVGHVLERWAGGGDGALLRVTGFGRKGLIDLKKALRAKGVEFELEEQEE